MIEHRIALKNVGRINPGQIEDYLAEGGYKALKRAIQMTPDEIVFELIQSGLRGRGGSPNCRIMVEPNSKVENRTLKSISHFSLCLISPSGT